MRGRDAARRAPAAACDAVARSAAGSTSRQQRGAWLSNTVPQRRRRAPGAVLAAAGGAVANDAPDTLWGGRRGAYDATLLSGTPACQYTSAWTSPHLSLRLTLPSGYADSAVLPTGLPQLQALQRRSFGHRNLRTYVVVVADARSPACQAIEAPVEALASGLRHERRAAVMAVDAADPSAASFAARILNVRRLPALLVYPEGAPGFLAYKGGRRWGEAGIGAGGGLGDAGAHVCSPTCACATIRPSAGGSRPCSTHKQGWRHSQVGAHSCVCLCAGPPPLTCLPAAWPPCPQAWT